MNADREVIFVDQRGTHLADPLLGCAEYDDSVNRGFSIGFTSPAAATADVAATKACRDRYAAAGVDLSAYNTKENAADIADLRVALGIPSWNLYGVSYGTKLALVTLRDHPQGIRTLVLDSVSPPNLNIAKDWWSAPAESFKAIFAACRAQPACAAAFPTLEADFFATIKRLDASPVVVATKDASGAPVTLTIDAFALAYTAIDGSEHGDPAIIPKMFADMARGNSDLVVKNMLAEIAPPQIVGLGGLGLAFTVFCGEAGNLTTEQEYHGEVESRPPGVPGQGVHPAAQAGAAVPAVPRLGRQGRRRLDDDPGREQHPRAHPRRDLRRGHRTLVGRPHHPRSQGQPVRVDAVHRTLGLRQVAVLRADHGGVPRQPVPAGRQDLRPTVHPPLRHQLNGSPANGIRRGDHRGW